MACRKISSQRARSGGKSCARNISALEVPPRMNTARNRCLRLGSVKLACRIRLMLAPFDQPPQARFEINLGAPAEQAFALRPAEIELRAGAGAHAVATAGVLR